MQAGIPSTWEAADGSQIIFSTFNGSTFTGFYKPVVLCGNPLYVAVGSFDTKEMASVGWTASYETKGYDAHSVLAFAGQFEGYTKIKGTYVRTASHLAKPEIGDNTYALKKIGPYEPKN